jgi:hypothetical protein
LLGLSHITKNDSGAEDNHEKKKDDHDKKDPDHGCQRHYDKSRCR